MKNEPEITKACYLSVASRFGLTRRELELGYLKVSGFSNRRIAQMLGISELTVKKHVSHIYEKAWVPGRQEFRALFLTQTDCLLAPDRQIFSPASGSHEG